jgi:hypothetical protein
MIERQRTSHDGSDDGSMDRQHYARSPGAGDTRQSMDYPLLRRYLLRYFLPLLLLIWGTVAAVVWVEAEVHHRTRTSCTSPSAWVWA